MKKYYRYKLVRHKGRMRQEHRVIMEKFLGRELDRFEFVHHKDGNTLNNEICNLEIVSPLEHRHIHPTSEESKAKFSVLFKGVPRSDEFRRKVSDGHKGKKFSPETCLKISLANKGKIIPLESRLKMSASAIGKVLSPETRRKISEIHKGLHTGSKHPSHKLIDSDIPKIRREIATGRPYKEIAKQFNVSPSRICDINKRRTWTHV